MLGRVDRFLYIGSANKRLYQRFGVPDSRLYSAPYAVDNERFAGQALALRPRRMELRRQWGIGDDAFCVLFCGKFIEKKRPLDLVKATRSLIASGQLRNIHLLFVGSGELGRELRQSCHVVYDADTAGSQAPESSIAAGSPSELPPASFTGFLNQTEISRAYVAADCLVLPSDHGETWGLVVNEALASGLPCIVSDACGCAEDLVDQRFSFGLGDIGILAERLNRLHQDKLLAAPKQPPSLDVCVGAITSAYNDCNCQN